MLEEGGLEFPWIDFDHRTYTNQYRPYNRKEDEQMKNDYALKMAMAVAGLIGGILSTISNTKKIINLNNETDATEESTDSQENKA